MPRGITAIHRLEAEFFQTRCFPHKGVAETLEEWHQALLLPDDWQVVGVTIIPVTDLFLILLESREIALSSSGLTYITPYYLNDRDGQVTLKKLTQSPARGLTDQKSSLVVPGKEQKHVGPIDLKHLLN
jgi:hypothetical protein